MPRQLVRDFGTSLSFPGTTSAGVAVPYNSNMNATSALTICSWIFPKFKNDSQYRRILDKGTSDTVYELTSMNSSTLSKGRMRIWISSSEKSAVTDNILIPGQWSFLVGRYDGAKVNIFVNGVKQSDETSTTGNIDTSTADLYIGASVGAGSTNEMWKGELDDVRLYVNRALTDTEILNLYAGIEPTTTGLAGWWQFNEGSGSSATDSSGNGNTGTITSATYSSNVVTKLRTAVS